MSAIPTNAYIQQRNNYLPKNLRLIFIFESPPAHKGYFYDDEGTSGELLYRTLTELLLGTRPEDKKEGLKMFADAGYLLVNPVYVPVNKLPDKEADRMILESYPSLVRDLDELMQGRHVPIILVKKNICRLLEPLLVGDGFKVLNNGRMIPFPMHYHRPDFEQSVKELMSNLQI